MSGRLFFCIALKVGADNYRNQAVTLKFRLLSVRARIRSSVSSRKMSVIAMFQQLHSQYYNA